MSSRSDGQCKNCRIRLTYPFWKCDTCGYLFCDTYCIQELITEHTDHCSGDIIQQVKKSGGTKTAAAVPCRFFLQGTCKHGDRCIFLHSETKNVCQYFLKGDCKFGKQCTNLHPVSYASKVQLSPPRSAVNSVKDKQVPICTHHLKGKCEYGNACYKRHVLPVFLEKRTPSQQGKSVDAKVEKKTKLTKDVKNIQVPNVPKKEGGGDEDFEYVQICQHYNRGSCAYGDSCSKAHVKLPLYKKDAPMEMLIKRKGKQVEKIPPSEYSGKIKVAYSGSCMVDYTDSGLVDDDNSLSERVENSTSRTTEDVDSEEIFMSDSDLSEDSDDWQLDPPTHKLFVDSTHRSCLGPQGEGPSYADRVPQAAGFRQPTAQPVIGSKNQGDQQPIRVAQQQPIRVTEKAEAGPKSGASIHQSKTEKKKIKKKDFNKLKNSANLFSVLQPSSDESSGESEDSGPEPQPDPQTENGCGGSVVQETKEESKKSKKEVKKLEKLNSQRIVIDNLRYEGNNQYSRNNFKAAITLYTNAINKAGPNNPDPKLYNNRAAAYFMEKNYRGAFNDSKKCMEIDKTNAKALDRFLRCCVVLGLTKDGLSKLKIYDKADKYAEYEEQFNELEQCYKEAVKYIEKDKAVKAETFVDKALKICHKSVEFTLIKAVVLALQQNLSKARQLLSSLDPKDPSFKCSWFYFLQGLLYYYENDLGRSISGFAESKRDIIRAELLHEKVAQMHNCIKNGMKCYQARDLKGAVDQFTAGLALGNDNQAFKKSLYKERSIVYIKLKEVDSAFKDITLALTIDEKDDQMWFLRANIYLEKKQYSKALEDFAKVLELAPSRKEILKLITDTKKRLYQQGVENSPHYKNAQIHLKNEEFEKALEDLAKVAKEFPASQEVKDSIADTEALLEKHKRLASSYYKILGVPESVPSQELKKQFYKKAKLFHPDKHSLATQAEREEMENKMKEISRAYDVLSDPHKRAEYDRKLYEEDDESEDSMDEYPFSVHDFFIFMNSLNPRIFQMFR